MVFKKNLKYLLKFSGIKQNSFGKIVGVSGASIGTYLKGPTTPDYTVLIKIAKHFNISIDDLLTKDLEVESSKKTTIYIKENDKLSGFNEDDELKSYPKPTTKQQQNKSITIDSLLENIIEEKMIKILKKNKNFKYL